VGADTDSIAFVPNATTGVNAVLRSLDLDKHDELLVTSHEYNASRNALEYVAGLAGAKVVPVEVPFPIHSPDEVIDRVMERVTDRTRLFLVDHVTSQTGLIFPIAELIDALNKRGIDTLVDGAHAPGMFPLHLGELGAAYYTGNLHKWVCAPKGAAFLYIRANRRRGIHPVVISHGANATRTDRSRFHLEFDWPGTFDPTACLCVPTALRFMASLADGGWPEVMRRNHELALRARDLLCTRLGIDKPAPDGMLGSMAVRAPDRSADRSVAKPAEARPPHLGAALQHDRRIRDAGKGAARTASAVLTRPFCVPSKVTRREYYQSTQRHQPDSARDRHATKTHP
jgi:isopenicillin-N epimerase